jgi:DNA modification methylase
MIEHFSYLLPELYRVLMPGRSVAIHLAQAQTRKRDGGEIGLRDFRGATISVMEAAGFTFYGEVTIDKNPQVKAVRTKDRGLLFKSLATDSANMRMAQADYMLQFRKPGENPHPIRAGISEKYGNSDGWITPEEWIEWAAPVWYRASEHYPGGIRETDVLNVSSARDDRDERHLCPLQLGVIERAVKLWSAPGEVVLSPFAGVGSEGVGALRLGRRFVGVELKRSYFERAAHNLRAAERTEAQGSIFGNA